MDYTEYLKSHFWKTTRTRKLKSAGYRCERCGKNAWHVHHTHYRTLGREADGDLLALCGTCHQEEHLRDRYCADCGRSLAGHGADQGELPTRCMDCALIWYMKYL